MGRFWHAPSGRVDPSTSTGTRSQRRETVVAQWWYCLVHQKVEPENGCPNSGTTRPFDTADEASHALEVAAKRNEEWEAGDNEVGWQAGRPMVPSGWKSPGEDT